MKPCAQCQQPFELHPTELEFLKKVAPIVGGRRFDIPEPKLCAPCRRQRRYAFRNDRNLYKRTCSKTGRPIISVFSPDKTVPVYAIDVWWSDAYDPLEYGRDFDFTRPFFEQMAELYHVVPRAACLVVNSENCDYTAFTMQSRNCFLSSRVANSEDIYYTYLALNSRSCFDCYGLSECELNYEGIDNNKCYQCFYTERSKGCFNLIFCADMAGCSDCFGCVGLVQKRYHFFNQPYPKEEYEKKVREVFDGSPESVARCRTQFEAIRRKCPVRALTIFNSENAFGSSIFDSKNAWNSFDIMGSQDVLNSTQIEEGKDLMDTDFNYLCELSYELISGGKSNRNLFSFALVGGSSDVLYSLYCNNTNQNLFGCAGMKNNRYCVLNKQYTQTEYEKLAARVIEHMQKTGEWGEFFPVELSGMGYNETVAQERFTLTREEVLRRGWRWHEVQEETVAQAEGENVMRCEVSGRSFRLIPQELRFYEQMHLPKPTRHPDVRHQDRLKRRNPYLLRATKCRKCQRDVWTDYMDDSLLIYCDTCYLANIY